MPLFKKMKDDGYRYFLLAVFLLCWGWSVWQPTSPIDWYLENKMVLLFIPVVYFLFVRYIQFSKLSLTLITLFVVLHLVGAHYSYGSVPFGFALGDFFGVGGNQYDKLVHFAFGFLIVYPVREFFLRIAQAKGFWGYLLPFSLILCFGALYEIFEWFTVFQYGGTVGYQFIGGNDPFDTTKDLAAAAAGSLLGLIVVGICQLIELEEKFWQSWKKSFYRDNLTRPKEDKLLHTGTKALK
jgi:putative membrane protein